MIEQDSFGKRIQRFMVLMVILFVVTITVVLVQRLSNDALALLVGLLAGVTVMAPSLILLLTIWRRQEARLHTQVSAAHPAPSPPVIVISPQGLPAYPQQRQLAWEGHGGLTWSGVTEERKFTIVGED